MFCITLTFLLHFYYIFITLHYITLHYIFIKLNVIKLYKFLCSKSFYICLKLIFDRIDVMFNHEAQWAGQVR